MTTEYTQLFQHCALLRENMLGPIASEILGHEKDYQAVEKLGHVPWPVIAAIHFRECNLNFKCHLHNGDLLAHRTVRAPKGRPTWGQPPFLWVESATDALMDIERPSKWDIPNTLGFLERYNGFGYRMHGINTPYLWSYTNQYSGGLFTSDDHFDPAKQDKRPGCVPILRALEKRGVSLDFTRMNEVFC